LDNSTQAKVKLEMSQVDELMRSSEPLLLLCSKKVPDFIETQAAAMVLHSFYNGIENILTLLFKGEGKRLPNGNHWHSELLEMSFTPAKTGLPVFRSELQKTLREYMRFRHFVRHNYAFRIDWEQMEGLTKNMMSVWNMAKEDLNNYIQDSSKSTSSNQSETELASRIK
jgi:hypothetical protein